MYIHKLHFVQSDMAYIHLSRMALVYFGYLFQKLKRWEWQGVLLSRTIQNFFSVIGFPVEQTKHENKTIPVTYFIAFMKEQVWKSFVTC